MRMNSCKGDVVQPHNGTKIDAYLLNMIPFKIAQAFPRIESLFHEKALNITQRKGSRPATNTIHA